MKFSKFKKILKIMILFGEVAEKVYPIFILDIVLSEYP